MKAQQGVEGDRRTVPLSYPLLSCPCPYSLGRGPSLSNSKTSSPASVRPRLRIGQGIEGGLQVGGQVVGERELLPRGGMGERQLERMQELALEPQVGEPGRLAGA